MSELTTKDLLDAGVHFGHLTRKWNPKMAPFIFMEKSGIHIIDLNKTLAKLNDAKAAVKNITRSGRKVMFVATKKQAKAIVQNEASRINMPYVTERWLGGMLTNFATVRKSIKKMQSIGKMATDGTYSHLNKKERLMKDRERAKLQRLLGGIEELNRLPAALFIVDVKREHKLRQIISVSIQHAIRTQTCPSTIIILIIFLIALRKIVVSRRKQISIDINVFFDGINHSPVLLSYIISQSISFHFRITHMIAVVAQHCVIFTVSIRACHDDYFLLPLLD